MDASDAKIEAKLVDKAFRDQLSAGEAAKFEAIESEAGVFTNLTELRRQNTALKDSNRWTRIRLVMDRVKPLAMAADTLASSVGMPSSSLWGAFGLVISMSSSRGEFLDAILKNYEALLEPLARIEEYLQVLSESKSLRLAIHDLFDEFLAVTMKCIQTFGRSKSSSLSVVQKIRWLHFTKRLDASRQKIKSLARKVHAEAGFALAKLNSELVQSNSRRNSEVSKRGIYCMPFQRNEYFTGRDHYLEEIHKFVSPEAVEEDKTQKSVALYGLSGVGKTQLAAEYFHQYKNKYEAGFWITCDTPVKITEGITEMARSLGFSDQDQGQESNQIRAMVKDWLNTTELSWVLVLDDVDKQADIQDIRPTCSKGSIIITTVDSSWKRREDITHSIDVKSLEKKEGVTMVSKIFEKGSGARIPQTDAERIFDEAGGLPLFIRHLSSFISAQGEDPGKFMDSYAEIANEVDAWDEEIPLSCPRKMSNFLKSALGPLNIEETNLLAAFCFLDPNRIQEQLLFDTPGVTPGLMKRSKFNTHAMKLLRYSLVSKTTKEGKITFDMHRQVKRHLLNHLKHEHLRHGLGHVLKGIHRLVPHQTPWDDEANGRKWMKFDFISHIVALNKEFTKISILVEDVELLARILLDGAFDLWIKGMLDEARELIVSAIDLCDKPGFDERLAAEIISFNGTIRGDLGELDAALESFEKSMSIQKGRLIRISKLGIGATSTDDIYLANAYNNLAGVYCAKGMYSKALDCNELSLYLKNKRKDELPLSHLLCLSYQNFANTLAQQDSYDEAATQYRLALAMGTGEVSTARRALAYHNFGCMRLRQNLVEEAKELLDQACRLRLDSLGDHIDTAASLHMLAVSHMRSHAENRTESLTTAKDLFAEAIQVLESTHCRKDKRRRSRTLYMYSVALEQLGDDEAPTKRKEAEALYFELTGNMPYGEEAYDALVPYV
ncbi:hypothetical protein G7046_g2977 [Stylonectria norvegica]|nr:hypothetical protein G7046_g2977 [Stylonectria norvegica]